MERKLIVRGVLAGALAGLFAFVFARILAEPQISKAIDYEAGRDAAQALLDKAAGLTVVDEGSEVFGRTVQANVGIGVGMIAFGAAMGALFAVVFAICLGRTGKVRPINLALFVAGAGFLGVFMVPFLKYPANPPSIGHAETIKIRSGLYLIMVVAGVVLLALAVWLGQVLQPCFGTRRAALLAGAGYIVAVGVVMLIVPSLGHLAANSDIQPRSATETPAPLRSPDGTIVYPGFPADVLFSFRLYSVGAQAILWATVGLVFGPLAERVLAPLRTASNREPVSI